MFDQSTRRLVYDLAFHAYPGLLVRVRKPGYGALRHLAGAEAVLGVGMTGAAVTGAARIEALGPVVDAFASSLVSWTLADNGVPVPATHAGVVAQDYDFLIELALTWYRRVVLRIERPDQPAADLDTPSAPDPVAEDALTEIPFTIGIPEAAPEGEVVSA